MPTAKLSVAHMLDLGPLAVARPTALQPALAIEAGVAELAPIESEAAVMAAVKRLAVTDRLHPGLVKVIRDAANPAEVAAASIKARHDLLGGARGFLGAATTVVQPCPDRVGFFQHFKGGSIYWSPYTGAHEVHGAIRAHWASLGWERSFLRYPRTDETKGADVRGEGRFNHFQGGSIYWHPSTGAHEVHGAIRAKYLELGAEASFLGYPTTDETATPDRVGRFNHFQAGSIYWTPGTGAHEVHGLIRHFWAQNGWERNPQLGYPVSDEFVPHRGVGHTRPPSIRKPILTLPLDVIRAPDEQPSPTLHLAVAAVAVAMPARFSRAPAVGAAVRQPEAIAPAPVAVARPVTELVRNPGLIRLPLAEIIPAASHKGQSQDRYSDFEDGVVFWRRGNDAAVLLQPRATAPGGAKMAWTAAEVVQLSSVPIRNAIAAVAGATMIGATFAGTTGYSFDGSGVRNRAHRIRVQLQGMRQVGMMPVPSIATVEVRVEISLDPVDREVVGYLVGWSLVASQGDFIGGGSLVRALHQRLDAALSRQFLITKIPATVDDPIAVLSVKTQADGDVVVYFEP